MSVDKMETLVASVIRPQLNEEEQGLIKASKIQLPEHSGGHLSPSQVKMYWRCGMQYYFRYVLGIKSPPTVAMVEGTTHHLTFEKNNKHKIKTGLDYKLKLLTEFFADKFDVEQKAVSRRGWGLAGDRKDSVINRARGMLNVYLSSTAPNLTPEIAEVDVEYVIGGVKVVGVVDVAGKMREGKGNVRGVFDYKTSGRKKSDDEVSGEIALAHYGWAALDFMKGFDLKLHLPVVGFITLLKSSTPSVHVQLIPLTISRIKWYRHQVIAVANAISLGSFPIRNSVGWECSDKYCGYWSRCRGKCK